MKTRQITITKLDQTGRPVLSYPGEIVYGDDNVIVARCVWGQAALDLGGFYLQPGDIFMEFYSYQEDFNIFRIYNAVGRLKGWYCNITAQVRVTEKEIQWPDLVLDLLVLPDGHQVIRDTDEFKAIHFPAKLRERALRAMRKLQRWVKERQGPFASAHFQRSHWPQNNELDIKRPLS